MDTKYVSEKTSQSYCVTEEMIQSRIVEKSVQTLHLLGKPVTVVAVKLQNGFVIIETSTCVDPVGYNESIGESICMERIEKKIWELEGYYLSEQINPRA